MPENAIFPPEELTHDLTISLWHSRGELRALARRRAWEPSIEDSRRIAERRVDELRGHGVFQIGRHVAPAHSVRPEGGPAAPAGPPVWRGRPLTRTPRFPRANGLPTPGLAISLP